MYIIILTLAEPVYWHGSRAFDLPEQETTKTLQLYVARLTRFNLFSQIDRNSLTGSSRFTFSLTGPSTVSISSPIYSSSSCGSLWGDVLETLKPVTSACGSIPSRIPDPGFIPSGAPIYAASKTAAYRKISPFGTTPTPKCGSIGGVLLDWTCEFTSPLTSMPIPSNIPFDECGSSEECPGLMAPTTNAPIKSSDSNRPTSS